MVSDVHQTHRNVNNSYNKLPHNKRNEKENECADEDAEADGARFEELGGVEVDVFGVVGVDAEGLEKEGVDDRRDDDYTAEFT